MIYPPFTFLLPWLTVTCTVWVLLSMGFRHSQCAAPYANPRLANSLLITGRLSGCVTVKQALIKETRTQEKACTPLHS